MNGSKTLSLQCSAGRINWNFSRDPVGGDSSACGLLLFEIGGTDVSADSRLLSVDWIKIDGPHLQHTAAHIRPSCLLLQLVIQLARLSKVHHMRIDHAPVELMGLYASFGFYPIALIRRGFGPAMLIDPQHALNTFSGLLNTHDKSVRHDDIRQRALVPMDGWAQPVCFLQQKTWRVLLDDSLHSLGFEVAMKLFNQPEGDVEDSSRGHHDPPAKFSSQDKQGGTTTHHGLQVEYGSALIHCKDDKVWVDNNVKTTDAAHQPAIEQALLKVGLNAGTDVRNGVWRGLK
jgi:hypothetical protein